MKLIIAFALLAIVASLALAGRAMLKDGRNGEAKSNRMVNALALRVGLSVALFVFVLISYKMGWIHPTGVPLGR
jgi:Tfp pilus assembly protein FimT